VRALAGRMTRFNAGKIPAWICCTVLFLQVCCNGPSAYLANGGLLRFPAAGFQWCGQFGNALKTSRRLTGKKLFLAPGFRRHPPSSFPDSRAFCCFTDVNTGVNWVTMAVSPKIGRSFGVTSQPGSAVIVVRRSPVTSALPRSPGRLSRRFTGGPRSRSGPGRTGAGTAPG
jgi:hypothetical protein